MTPREVLEAAYSAASDAEAAPAVVSAQQREWVFRIIDHVEKQQKSVLTALVTCLVKKVCDPEQDVRCHRIDIPNRSGFNARSYDEHYVTPFMQGQSRLQRFALDGKKASAWMTDSLDAVHAYDLHYPIKFKNNNVKIAFLYILNDVEEKGADAVELLRFVFSVLAVKPTSDDLLPSTKVHTAKLRVEKVFAALESHLSEEVVSRLLVIAVYSIYQCFVESSSGRYADTELKKLRYHTSPDKRAKGVGDIEVLDASKNYIEAVEVQHEKVITSETLRSIANKVKQVQRYYLLSTARIEEADKEAIRAVQEDFHKKYRSEVIVDDVTVTIGYHLRLVDLADFISHYTRNLKTGHQSNVDITDNHLKRWNKILAELNAENSGADDA